ncbi:hypothetical protein [Dendronalium sp. ChiSLP03b]|uniref:hypothetical protein n=1 Tax=Dendronalium sp. ChiSLP03b TaxID=3075381 RepID=UPI002AD3920F|nr:hypothetical protein [Dendronalium sp. ChiSLP03b]MDZ8205904.1 hypothetical protein [Dendronalium sp. ChiSLP03b]
MSVSVSVTLHNGDIIGYSNLKWSDPSMGVLSGQFTPISNYESIAYVFQFFAENPYSLLEKNDLRDVYNKMRDEMGLQLFDHKGDRITDAQQSTLMITLVS